MNALVAGFSLSLSLILAIGAQNAFVLKQGLKKHHVFMVCGICALSDAILIVAGVAGFGALIASFPAIESIASLGGAAFLIAYGSRSLISAFTAEHALDPAGDATASAWKTALACLAFTWLNPHVYLDTLVLIGSISTQYSDKLMFTAGAVAASLTFFFSLGYGARLLTPIFQQPRAWKMLDGLIALIMYAIAASLLLRVLDWGPG
ncbi:amino acid transporter [Seongchinamella unica]|uniref:Amino acid transporter n=1 Tax=Seongchinamella unica TaxID=2547392 RepID=A0A4R5LVL1_9GAMM|nr:LysE/ArgO family amino acid transporter [Seongchinamella unica]TDG15473.1 amino acid transporter [Seongchinamella unica]